MGTIEKSVPPNSSIRENGISESDILNRYFDSVINHIQEGIVIANPEGEFIYFNSSAEEILGFGSLDIPADEWSATYGCYYPDKTTLFPPDEIPLYKSIKEKINATTKIFIRNKKRPEGIFIEVNSSPIYDNNGEFIGGVAYFRDITERIISENKLKNSENKFQSLFRGIPLPTYVWQKQNDNFILVDHNNYSELITNGNIKNLHGRTLQELFPDSPEVYSDFDKCFSEKKTVEREMGYTMKTTNEYKDFFVTYVFIEPDLVMVHTHDITKKKAAEKELQKLSKAVQQTDDAVLITNPDGIIEYVNNGFTNVYGYNSEEVLGKKPSILKSGQHDDDFYKEMWGAIRNKESFKCTLLNKKKDGSNYWVQQSITPIIGENGEIINFVAVNKDISELKKRIEGEIELIKSESIISNILPESIAKRLKDGESTIADFFESASVIFIDIIGFSKMTSVLSPQVLVQELNKIFKILDKLSQQFGLEKIKTIGDCYMAASGIPHSRSDHAQSIAFMALETLNQMKGYTTESGFEVKFRIGIDSGPVVAGIIGESKLIYDLWGECVNNASRMKETCVSDRIHCSERFLIELNSRRANLKKEIKFKFSDKIKINFKNIGEVNTYYLLDKL